MVSQGQFLERSTLIPVEPSLVLEGLSHRGQRSPSVLIVPPAPNDGSMDHVVCAELAWAAATRGHPSLRFNFRGVGASQGRYQAPMDLAADLAAAHKLAEENAPDGRIALVGVGSSALAVLGFAQREEVAGVVLVAPPALLSANSIPRPLRVVLAEEDSDRSLLTVAAAAIGASVEVIPRADRAMTRSLPELGRRVMEWIAALSN